MDAHRMQRNISSHEEILTALERRNAEVARESMQNHIHESGQLVIAWLENQTQGLE
jgi:DNA-binding GntR family transcriptional regulator